jgi:2-alkyl-3-oxoalkanoate reductase
MATMLITGGTGFLGSWILEEMRKADTARRLGYDVLRVLARSPERAAGISLPGVRVEVHKGDLLDPASLKTAATDADTILHVAALYDTSSPWSLFYRSNVVATRALIDGMKQGAKLVLTSTYGVYGFPSAGHPITEDYEPKRPLWHYQRTKKLQEDLARAVCREKGIRFVALRPPTVIGPGELLSVPTMLATIESGGMMLVGDGSNTIPLAHASDAARAHLLALEKIDQHDGGAFHFASFHATFRAWVDAMAEALGCPPVRRTAPRWLARTVGAAGDAARLFGARSAYTGFSVAFAGSNDVLDDTRIRRELGWAPSYDLARTVRECVDWYRAAKPSAR